VTLTEIAARISDYLKRFERDLKINVKINGLRRYYRATAYRGGAYVRVRYISYQGAQSLTRAEATAYLAWLDAGNAGTVAFWNDREQVATEAAQLLVRGLRTRDQS